MKYKKQLGFIFIFSIIYCCGTVAHNKIHKPQTADASIIGSARHGINIYIISKDKYFDLTNRIILWQAKLSSLFHSEKLKIVTATCTANAEKKISALVNKNHCVINNIWFDSHGKYRKGYSSFMIGRDEYDYKNISDSSHFSELKKIAAFCTTNTKVGIGACYAAADYNFPVLQNSKLENMYGDSLLKGMGNIFKGSSIYACKSWVMAKPWVFGSKNALAGFPLDRQYKDTIFIPVWKRMGEWNMYSTTVGIIEPVKSIYLSADGDIRIRRHSYLEKKKAQRKLARNLRKLRPNLYTL
jgi:hypothetical protein